MAWQSMRQKSIGNCSYCFQYLNKNQVKAGALYKPNNLDPRWITGDEAPEAGVSTNYGQSPQLQELANMYRQAGVDGA